MPIDVAVIGYGKHAKKLLTLGSEFFEIKASLKPKRRKEILSRREIETILRHSAIFITSPDWTHCHYVKLIHDLGYRGYVFCEKPLDLDFGELNNNFLKRLFVNWSYRHSQLLDVINKLKSSPTSELVSFNIYSSNSLYLKNPKDWRFRDVNNKRTFLVKGSHWLDLLSYIFPDKILTGSIHPLRDARNRDMVVGGQYRGFIDQCPVNITCTYNAPLIFEGQFVYSDFIIRFDMERIAFLGPTKLDANGMDVLPSVETIIEGDWVTGALQHSLSRFYKMCVDRTEVDPYYQDIVIKTARDLKLLL